MRQRGAVHGAALSSGLENPEIPAPLLPRKQPRPTSPATPRSVSSGGCFRPCRENLASATFARSGHAHRESSGGAIGFLGFCSQPVLPRQSGRRLPGNSPQVAHRHRTAQRQRPVIRRTITARRSQQRFFAGQRRALPPERSSTELDLPLRSASSQPDNSSNGRRGS